MRLGRIGAPVVGGEGELEMPATVEGDGGKGSGGGVWGLEADDGSVGEFTEPGMVAKGPVGALDVLEGLGDIGAVFLVAELADILGALLEGVVVAGGEEEG